MEPVKCPYWLIHEPGKSHGFGTVQHADSATEAIAIWKKENQDWVAYFGNHQEYAARVISEPFVP